MTADESGGTDHSEDPCDALRARIDGIDAELVERLVERAGLARAIGALKRGRGEPVVDAERERRILARVREQAAGRLPEAALRAIYREILNLTRAAALGPEADGVDPAGTGGAAP